MKPGDRVVVDSGWMPRVCTTCGGPSIGRKWSCFDGMHGVIVSLDPITVRLDGDVSALRFDELELILESRNYGGNA